MQRKAVALIKDHPDGKLLLIQDDEPGVKDIVVLKDKYGDEVDEIEVGVFKSLLRRNVIKEVGDLRPCTTIHHTFYKLSEHVHPETKQPVQG